MVNSVFPFGNNGASPLLILVGHRFVDMPGKLAVTGRPHEVVNVLKPRCAGIQALPVNAQMPVVTDDHPLAAKRHQAFDVKLILRQPVDALGLKDDDLPAPACGSYR